MTPFLCKRIPGLFIFILLTLLPFCKKADYDNESKLILSSPEIAADSLLPADYTCDGTSSTLPLEWSGEPVGTESFALIMHHEASPTDIHWYWVLYNIPATVHSLDKNTSGIGTLGTNSVNDRKEYAPPCSQGPGIKAYTYTIYALSGNPGLSLPQTEVTRAVLLTAIEDLILDSSEMTVYYSRNVK